MTELNFRLFSKTLGSRGLGGLLIKRADVFVNVFMKGGIKRRKLSTAEREMYKRPHPTPASREPVHVMPREILTARELLAEVEAGLERVADKPALIVWGDKDQAFKEAQRLRWERTFPTTGPTSCAAPRTTSRKTPQTRSSPQSPTGGPRPSRASVLRPIRAVSSLSNISRSPVTAVAGVNTVTPEVALVPQRREAM